MIFANEPAARLQGNRRANSYLLSAICYLLSAICYKNYSQFGNKKHHSALVCTE